MKKPTNQQLDELQQRVQILDDQLKRAVADYHNLEKRVIEGRSELSSWASTELIKKLLPVLDHLEKALKGLALSDPIRQAQGELNGWTKGVELAVSELRNVLKNEGLEQIGTEGQFDPSLHEAVDMRDGDDNIILEVVTNGYKIGNKVVRPSQVIVGRNMKDTNPIVNTGTEIENDDMLAGNSEDILKESN